ncbi:hypothetical protein MAR_011477 [Mya arenaria]|uniref:Uncharacterized protein n=1 Tax=Mya arenaria TaxID=6604 RepID=A0ABY7FU78_MYAAR|nr:hypothetical protein MAR_011477 [Mya arenaria]
MLPSTVDCNKKPIGVAPLGPVIVRSQINQLTSADFVKGMGAFNKSARPVVVAMVLIPTLFVVLWNVYTHWRKCQHKRHNQPGEERDVQRHIVYVGGKFKKKPLTII